MLPVHADQGRLAVRSSGCSDCPSEQGRGFEQRASGSLRGAAAPIASVRPLPRVGVSLPVIVLGASAQENGGMPPPVD
jgi:hypothetical protein